MKIAITKIITLSVLVFFSCIALVWLTPTNKQHYLATAKDKNTLIKTTPSPRLIFVGGSNLSFGLDSEKIHRETGYNVINMGLHAGLGIRYMLAEVREFIRPGDTIILMNEYAYLLNGGRTLLELTIYYPDAVSFLKEIKITSIIRELPTVLQRRVTGLTTQFLRGTPQKTIDDIVYSREAFNRYGDVVRHLQEPCEEDALEEEIYCPADPSNSPVVGNMVNLVNGFHQFVKEKKARLLFSFPPIPEKYYQLEQQRLTQLYTYLQKTLTMSILGEPATFRQPNHWYYNSSYHLGKEGREYHTRKIIRLLLKNKYAPVPQKAPNNTTPPNKD